MHITLFAQTPPPTHGQSLTIKLLLEGLSEDRSPDAIVVHHVNARFSDDISSIGGLQPRKLIRLIKFCFQAIWFRVRYRSKVLVYVPAPGLRVPIYRDCVIMLMCRPFYPRLVYHWHAAGLGEWLERNAGKSERKLTQFLLGKPDLSILVSRPGESDAKALFSKKIAVVPNAIQDACPDFETHVLPRRRFRLVERVEALASPGKTPIWFNVLFLGLCMREKGLFDAIEAVRILNVRLTSTGKQIRARLTVAGKFWLETEEREFRRTMQVCNGGGEVIRYAGFADEHLKRILFLESDCFCFPTFYSAETFGLVLLEAMSWGLPIVASSWRAIPEIMPPNYSALVPPNDPAAISGALEEFIVHWNGLELRRHFESHYLPQRMTSAFKTLLLGLKGD